MNLYVVRNVFTALGLNSWVVCFCLLALSVTRLTAAPGVLTWTGASPTSANWSDTQNWDSPTIPQNGTTLICIPARV
jgi:hypothetical protein